MTEKIKKTNKLAILGTLLVLMLASIGYLGFHLYTTNEALVKASMNTKQINETATEKETKLQELESELAKLNDRMEGIKTNDDLLKRDVFLYIDKKFQIIPKTVSLDIAEQVLRLSKKHHIAPELVVGVIQVESAFNPMAISKANARGLMQVMPEWAPKFGLKKVSNLHDIDTNIDCGIQVLKIHIEEGKGNISKGLYYYVGKSDEYAGKVYQAMGKFVAFRSTIDDDTADIDINAAASKETEGIQLSKN